MVSIVHEILYLSTSVEWIYKIHKIPIKVYLKELTNQRMIQNSQTLIFPVKHLKLELLLFCKLIKRVFAQNVIVYIWNEDLFDCVLHVF